MVIEAAMIPEDVAVFEAAAGAVRGYARDYGLLPKRYQREVIDRGNPQTGLYMIEYIASQDNEWSVAAGVRQSALGVEQYIAATWRVGTRENGVVDVYISLTLGQGFNALKARQGRITMYCAQGPPLFAYAQFPKERGRHRHLLPPEITSRFTEVGAQELVAALVQGNIKPTHDIWNDKEEVLAAISRVMVA